MQRRTFLRSSLVGASGLVGVTRAATGLGALDPPGEARSERMDEASEAIGRPVRVTSISFPNGMPLAEIAAHVDRAGAGGTDVIALPELCRGQNDESEEDLLGPTVTAMAALARKHQAYIVCPIDRRAGELRLNSAVLLDRSGKVAGVYDKVFPYWSEYDLRPPAVVGGDAQVFQTDFGMLGLATCFDVNFPEIWQRLADKGAELVIWPSAYSAGTSLQAHAINHHFYIVSVTQTTDCLVYDITGERLFYKKGEKLNVTAITLDLDRSIYHENFNIQRRDRLLKERPAEVEQEKWLKPEQWFILRAKRPGVSARQLAEQYEMEELRHYINRSRLSIDARRGWQYDAKVVFPNLDEVTLRKLSTGHSKDSFSG